MALKSIHLIPLLVLGPITKMSGLEKAVVYSKLVVY